MVSPEVATRINGNSKAVFPELVTEEGYIATAKDQNFGVPFARDAAITSEFSLKIYEIHSDRVELLPPVKASLYTMAINQGQVVEPLRDEEPGRVYHEKRDETLYQNLGEIFRKNQEVLDNLQDGNWPVEGERGRRTMLYFGSIDATPLFISVAASYLLLTKDKEFFRFLDLHIRAAISWIENYGDTHGDGYVRFSAKNRHALLNQGWKDSLDSIEIAPSQRPPEPIALVEVQGYVYQAYLRAAELYRVTGDTQFAKDLYQKAGALKVKFNQDFWMEDEEFFAHALDGNNKQVREIVSNVGHLLATGIIDEQKVPFVVSRLMQPDMLTPYGIRTLSQESWRFSDQEPSAYHNGGAIWPHDNALSYLGFLKCGYIQEAEMLKDAVLRGQWILHENFGLDNLELFIVDRDDQLRPYKTAQRPQTWAAAANLVFTEIS